MSCDICTGLGDSWHYTMLPEPVQSGLLLVEYGVPSVDPLDRDRFLLATSITISSARGSRLGWAPTNGWGGDELVENDDHHTVRWQWLRGEPNALMLSASERTAQLRTRSLLC